MTLFDLDQHGTEPERGGAEPQRKRAEPEEPGSARPASTVRIRLEVAYDGSGFRGFAAQAGQHTVGGALADAVATVVRHPVEITCAGRTDAGVHALGQVVHLDVRADVDLAKVVKSVNTLLGPAVVVRRADKVDESFDARRSAGARHYRYLVLETAAADPLLAGITWHVPGPLDLRAMAAGADALLGEHDFRAFCRRPPGTEPASPIVRRVLDATWRELVPAPDGLGPGERLLRFDVSAQSFCHQMVRSMVGVLVDVGRARRRPSDVVDMLRSGDRSRATSVAPPHGLCLVSVDF
ncbi:MAG TPA: tRNA pseudouridine(38-40) synthase TruA [Acidimicrobiaceae bacterium]|nr:tRNA pseudouridine(38-40) synthase TruA [Acidimicrobiaceae bacterium]